MTLPELKALLKGSDQQILQRVMEESYKAVPRNRRKEVDAQIQRILSGEDAKERERRKKKKPLPMDELEKRVQTFVYHADNMHYRDPVQDISTEERRTWRYHVQEYIQLLQTVPGDADEQARAIVQMADLFRLLCEAQIYEVFKTQEPFEAIGIPEEDVFAALVEMVATGDSRRENFAAVARAFCTEGAYRREKLAEIAAEGLREDIRRRMVVGEAERLRQQKQTASEEEGIRKGLKEGLQNQVKWLTQLIEVLQRKIDGA